MPRSYQGMTGLSVVRHTEPSPEPTVVHGDTSDEFQTISRNSLSPNGWPFKLDPEGDVSDEHLAQICADLEISGIK